VFRENATYVPQITAVVGNLNCARQPDDAALVSRRAIEIGHLAIAVHLDSRNYVRWLDEKRRTARWQERMIRTTPEI